MKRIFFSFFTLLLAVFMTACGQAAEPPQEEENAQRKEEYAIPLEMVWERCSLQNAGLCEIEYDVLRLAKNSAEQFPKLQEALQEIEEQAHEGAEGDLHMMSAAAAEMLAEMGEEAFYSHFISERKSYIQRADDRILSIRNDAYEYSGGAHGMYGSGGYNYDPSTGQELYIDDVITDVSVLPAMITEIIIEKYADEYNTFDSLQEYLDGFMAEDYNWTMHDQGVTFYFVPYEIASYADGQLTATIWFQEKPELFQEKYLTVPEDGYAIRLCHTPVEIDLNGTDEKRDTLSAYLPEMAEEMPLMAVLNDTTISTDTKARAASPYLVCLQEKEGEQYFLCAEMTFDGGGEAFEEYVLTSDGIAEIELTALQRQKIDVIRSRVQEVKPMELTYFDFSHSGSMANDNYTYSFTKTEEGTQLYLEGLFSGGQILEMMIEDDWMDRAGRIAAEYELVNWDGFEKTNSMVLDGSGFSLSMTLADGRTVSARGNNAFPDGYSNAYSELYRMYHELLAAYGEPEDW